MSDQEESCAFCRENQPCDICRMLQCIEKGDHDGFLAILELACKQNPISDVSDEELFSWTGLKRPEKKLDVSNEQDQQMLAAWLANNPN